MPPASLTCRAAALAATALVVLAPAAATARTDAAPAPPVARLAAIPLDRDGWRGAGGLPELRDQTGPVSNARFAADSKDPADTATSVAGAGRITGYQVTFGDVGLATTRGRLIGLASAVHVFTASSTASAGLRRQIRSAQLGGSSGRIVGTSRFGVELGDEALGVRTHVRVDAVDLWFTGVAVRRGSLLLTANLLRTDALPGDELAVAAARAVLARADAQSEPVTRTVQGRTLDLGRALLGAGQIGGASVTRDVSHGGQGAIVSSRERMLALSQPLGASRLGEVHLGVSLHRSARSARALVDGLATTIDPAERAFEHAFRQVWAEGAAGLRVTSLEVASFRRLASGAVHGAEVVVRIRTRGGTVDGLVAYAAVGRISGWVYAFTPPGGRLATADAASLTDAVTAQLAAAQSRL